MLYCLFCLNAVTFYYRRCDLVFLHACLPKWFSTDVKGTLLPDIRHQRYRWQKFSAGVVDSGWCTLTCEHLHEQMIQEKKPEAKNLVTLSR
jgi:hypothetical protein